MTKPTQKTATVTPIKTPTLDSQVEIITPEMAEQYLAANTHNRPLSDSSVTSFAEDMVSGRWLLNGDAIRFTLDGTLLDGQHRLAAIVEAGISVPMLVIRNLPADVFETIDAGRRRSASDVLHVMGTKNSIETASAGRVSLLFSTRGQLAGPVSRSAITSYTIARPYLAELVAQWKVAKASHITSASPSAAVLFLANERRLMDNHVAAFIEGVGSGADLQRGDPRLALREWAINERSRARGFIATKTAFAAVARAWTAYMQGRDLRLLKIPREGLSAQSLEIAGFHFGVGNSAQAIHENR